MIRKVDAIFNSHNYLPKYNNSVYQHALEQKIKMRSILIERIKEGAFFEGMAPLFIILNKFTSNEIKQIINFWKNNRKTILLHYYLEAITKNNIDEIRKADDMYFLRENINILRRI